MPAQRHPACPRRDTPPRNAAGTPVFAGIHVFHALAGLGDKTWMAGTQGRSRPSELVIGPANGRTRWTGCCPAMTPNERSNMIGGTPRSCLWHPLALVTTRNGSPMTRRSIALFGVLAFVVALAAARPAAAQITLFEGARIIPGDGGAAIESGALLVDGGVIARIGRKGEIVPPAGAARIALDGKTIMPAIVSAHVHPGFQKGLTYSAANYTRETVLDDLNRALYFGVSTVMSQ